MRLTSGMWLERRTDDGIVVAQLNRPPANALTVEFLEDIAAEVARLEADGSVRALVLAGFDKTFCAGMDLKMLGGLETPAQQGEVVDVLNRTYGVLYGFAKPYVVAVSGHAIAGGLFFLLAADHRVGAHGAGLYGLSEVRVGVSFPVAPLEIALAELPTPVARRIILSGRPIDCEAALAGGILDELVDAERVEEQAIEAARRLAASPAEAYTQIKRQMRRAVLDKIARAVAGEEPLLAGWFTPETAKAALEVLGGKR